MGNRTGGNYGGIYDNLNHNCNSTVTNCILWGNSHSGLSDESAQIYALPYLVSYSCIQDWVDRGTGNISNNPQFLNQAGGDYHPQAGSPCIDTGDNNAVPSAVTTDIDGIPRKLDGDGNNTAVVDMGAYEFHIIFVNIANTQGTTHNGSTWAKSYLYLQDVLARAVAGQEIWVAQGTYRPDQSTAMPNGTGNRDANFALINGVQIYGGFDGNEMYRSQRNWLNNVTTLSGSLNNGQNSYHVVENIGVNETAILDGFTITGGKADGNNSSLFYNCGGGMLNSSASPTITDCNFKNNKAQFGGGAIYNDSNSSPVITSCLFVDNDANMTASSLGYGGAIYNNLSSPEINNCSFISNMAKRGGGAISNIQSRPTLLNCAFSGNKAVVAGMGGAVYDSGSSPLMTNCIFTANSANSGGGIYNESNSSPTLVNCTFNMNSATGTPNPPGYGGGVYNSSSCSPVVTNCIFWGDAAFQNNSNEIYDYNSSASPIFKNCDIAGCGGSANWQGGFGRDGGQNIAADPCFISADDLHLQGISRCIDKGDNAAVPAGVKTDFDGKSRFLPDYAPIVDMGAYEYVPPPFVIISAGEYVPITLPANEPNVQLIGRVIRDDAHAIYRTYWEVVYNPKGAILVFDPCLPAEDLHPSISTPVVSPRVTFPNDVDYSGNYGIRLVAKDDNNNVLADDIAWVMLKGGNTGPTVIPGSYGQVEVGQVLQLNGVVYDDGLPRGVLNKRWSFYSDDPNSPQGANVIFANPEDPNTTVTFTRKGDYVLRLWASDTAVEVNGFAVIKVINHDEPPSVEAGADKTIFWGQTHDVNLADASVSDDGGDVTSTWSLAKVDGSNGTVNFGILILFKHRMVNP